MYENADMTDQNGIPINLISRESLGGLGSKDRVFFVLNEVKQGKVLILETGLSALEEASLIEHTMKEIDHETFIGIEIQSYSNAFPRVENGNWLDRLLKRKKTPRMAVIGPASLLRTIHKDGNVIQTMLVTREHVIENAGEDGKKEGVLPGGVAGEVEQGIENEEEREEGGEASHGEDDGKDEYPAGDEEEDEEEDSGIIHIHNIMEEYGIAEGGN